MSIKVLWVEEEPRSMTWERRQAENKGWQINSVETASDAKKEIRHSAYDLIVVDLIIPVDSFTQERRLLDSDAGIELIEEIRNPERHGRTPSDVPILVTSAVVSPDQKDRVLAHLTSEHHYLQKPLEDKAYLAVVEELTIALSQPQHSA